MHRFILSVSILLCAGIVRAQTAGNSPYSLFGVGDLYPSGFITNQGMAGVGLSTSDNLTINNVNPALLAKTKVTVFDVGAFVQIKNLKEGNRSQQLTSGNINYLSLAFPVSSKWTMGLNLMPYTRVDYENTTQGLLFRSFTDFNTITYTNKGTGGLTQVNFSNGVELGKGFHVGLKTTYLFGVINKEQISQVNIEGSYTTALRERNNYSDFRFEPGFAYRQQLKKDKLFANIGGTYAFSSNVNTKRLSAWESRVGDQPFRTDTISNDEKGNLHLPATAKIGVSLEAPYHWMVGVDFTYQPWSKYTDFGANGGLSDTYTIAVGTEYIPNVNSVSSYWKRVTYRFGANFSQMPYTIEGTQLNDKSLSVGASLPVKGYTSMNLAFTAGQRGKSGTSLIQEQYFRISVGFTLRDRWFQRRQID